VRVTRIVRAAFALLFAAACGGMSARPFGSDASPLFPYVGPDAGDAGEGGAEASGGDAGLPDAMLIVSPPPPDAGPPPVVSCGGDAATDAGSDASAADGQAPDSGGDCPLPAPSCVDQYWQVYYSGGICQAGLCAYTQHVVACNAVCSNGHCGLIPVTE
jgi:hypothetical protein